MTNLQKPTESGNIGPWLADNQSRDLNTDFWLVVYLVRSVPANLWQTNANVITGLLFFMTTEKLTADKEKDWQTNYWKTNDKRMTDEIYIFEVWSRFIWLQLLNLTLWLTNNYFRNKICWGFGRWAPALPNRASVALWQKCGNRLVVIVGWRNRYRPNQEILIGCLLVSVCSWVFALHLMII